MKTRLSIKETIVVASMLFGLFFGAGNLIFPVSMGQQAGSMSILAAIGFCVTGVGLPLLGIVALAKTNSKDVFSMSSLVGSKFAYFFTVLLYLCIGPLFAIPRAATVSFQVGIVPLLKENTQWVLVLFSFLFFVAVLYFSLRPSKILTWVGKLLNPLFLSFLSILMLAALLFPMGKTASVLPSGKYVHQAFFTGFLEGYNTMDALASLAFGIILIDVIRNLGIKKGDDIEKATMKSGFISSFFMSLIYFILTLMGAQSVNQIGISSDGGIALFAIAKNYFGLAGGILLGCIITIACLKTSIGLVTSISETFTKLFPKFGSYRKWAFIFSIVSFVIANAGLNVIMKVSVPFLMFLYPLTIVLILLGLMGKYFGYRKSVFEMTMFFTTLVSGLDLVIAVLGFFTQSGVVYSTLIAISHALPFSDIGMSWIVFAMTGFIIGLVWKKA